MPRLGFGPRRIYLVGGIEGGAGVVSTVRAYGPALDSWCEVASMATKRSLHGAAALGGKLYVIGGFHPGEMEQVEVYDPKADGWQPLPSMPTARSNLAAVAVAGKVYAIGGATDERLCDAVEAYDPLSGLWSRAASLPMARSSHTAAVVDGKIYVVGGEISDDEGEAVSTDRVDMYDPAANSWQQMAAMPTARDSHAAAVVDGKIYVTGGYSEFGDASGGCSDALESYDPVTNTWTTLASLDYFRAWHASAAIKGKLLVFGGSSDGRTALVNVYSPASNSWGRAIDLPCAMDKCVALAL